MMAKLVEPCDYCHEASHNCDGCKYMGIMRQHNKLVDFLEHVFSDFGNTGEDTRTIKDEAEQLLLEIKGQ